MGEHVWKMNKLLYAVLLVSLVLMGSCVRQVDVVKIPALPPALYRVNCGAVQPYTDKSGNEWMPDQEFAEGKKWGALGGLTVDRRQAGLEEIEGTDDDAIYLTERYSMQAYRFDVPKGRYLLRLHFAETYEGITAERARVFSVRAEGKPILENFDPYKQAKGRDKSIVKQFLVEVSDGALDISFVPGVQNQEINGIEILMK